MLLVAECLASKLTAARTTTLTATQGAQQATIIYFPQEQFLFGTRCCKTMDSKQASKQISGDLPRQTSLFEAAHAIRQCSRSRGVLLLQGCLLGPTSLLMAANALKQ